MRILVTRPEADAADVAAELRARGHEVLLQPLLTIHQVEPNEALPLANVQALIFTSANGVRAFAAASSERDLPALAVGDATTREAGKLGFRDVESADGTVEDVARLAVQRFDPDAGCLFHAAASAVAGDLKGALESAGFSVERRVLYHAEPVESLTPQVAQALATGALDVVLFYSPRSASSFLQLITRFELEGACRSLWALCLSAAVADRLDKSRWAGVRIAERPRQDSLLKSLDALDLSSMMGARGKEQD